MREQVTWWDVEATGATSRPIGRLFPENSCFLGNGCRVREIPRGGGGKVLPSSAKRWSAGARDVV